MLLTAPLKGLSSKFETPLLCYEVSCKNATIYNVLTDVNVSVNALVSEMPDSLSEAIAIGIQCFNYSGDLVRIEIQRAGCVVTIDGKIARQTYRFDGVRVEKQDMRVRVEVPSSPIEGSSGIVMWIMCVTHPLKNGPRVDFITFSIVSGSYLTKPHGIVGQFWKIGSSAQKTKDAEISYALTLAPNTNREKRFEAALANRDWKGENVTCFYAGDGDGYPVIDGSASDYVTDSLFNTEFKFNKFRLK